LYSKTQHTQNGNPGEGFGASCGKNNRRMLRQFIRDPDPFRDYLAFESSQPHPRPPVIKQFNARRLKSACFAG
jgi:hypothetical protein